MGVGSSDRQALLNNTIALARTAVAFDLPVVVSTSASKVYSGPLMPPIQAVLPGVMALERRNMNVWEDDSVREAILKTQRRRLIVSGVLTEACVSFPALSTLTEGYEVYVVTDACGGITVDSHGVILAPAASSGAAPGEATAYVLATCKRCCVRSRASKVDGLRHLT